MRTKICFLFLFVSLVICGCNTIKGVASGFGEGISKDAQAAWNGIKGLDPWLQENAW